MRNVTNNALSRLSTPQLCRQPAPPSSFNSAALGIILGERCVWRVGTGRGRLPALFTCPTVQVVSAAQLIYRVPTYLHPTPRGVNRRRRGSYPLRRSDGTFPGFLEVCLSVQHTRAHAHTRTTRQAMNRCTHCLCLSSGTDDVNVTRHTT